MNLDPNEVAKFSQSTEAWWSKNGAFKALHHINPCRLNYVNNRAKLKGANLLDIGCGGGIFAEALAKQEALVTGIDANPQSIQIASEHAIKNDLKINYITTYIEDYAQEHARQFDIITCMELLEHVPDPYLLIKACSKLVKKNGDVFFSTINRNMKSYYLAIITAEHLLKLLPRHTHDYQKFIRPTELANWCLKHQLSPKNISGMHYIPFINHCALTTKPSINYLLHAKLDEHHD